MIHFDWPWLFLLLPLPVLVYFLLPPVKKSAAALFIPLLDQYGLPPQSPTQNPDNKIRLLLFSLLWLCLIVAAARPIWVGEPIDLENSGRDLFLAVDISGSMQTPDMELNGQEVDRLTMVKQVLSDFIKQRQGDRLGLILFASKAFVQAPLTLDLSTVQQLLNEALIGFAGQQTAIGDAIALAVKRLENNPDQHRTLILLTDGANNAGDFDPVEAAKRAAQAHITIYTIAFGSNKPIASGFFGMSMGNYGDDMDEASLQKIAQITGGQYFRARNHQELAGIYQAINQIEKRQLEKNLYHPKQSLFFWPLALAMLLFFVLLISQHTTRSKS